MYPRFSRLPGTWDKLAALNFYLCSLRRPWAACWSRKHRNTQRQSYRSTAVIPIAPAFLRSTTSRFGPQGPSSISFHELRDSLKSNDKEHAPIADLFSMESLLPTRLLGDRLLALEQ